MPVEAPSRIPEAHEILNWVLGYTRTAAGVTYDAIQEHFLGSCPSDEDVLALRELVDPLRSNSRVTVTTKPLYRAVNGWASADKLDGTQREVLRYVRELTEDVGGSCVGMEIVPFEVEGRENAERALCELTDMGALTRVYEETWKIKDPIVDTRGEISG